MSGKKEIVFEETAGPDGAVMLMIPGRGMRYFVFTSLIPTLFMLVFFLLPFYEQKLVIAFVIAPLYFYVRRNLCLARTEVEISAKEIKIRKTLGWDSKRPTIVSTADAEKFTFDSILFIPIKWKVLGHNSRFRGENDWVSAVVLKTRGEHYYIVCDYMKYGDREKLCARLNQILAGARGGDG